MKVGDQLTLRIGRGYGVRKVEVTYVGPLSVQVKDEEGLTHTMTRKHVRNQLYGRPKRRKLTKAQKRAIKRKEAAIVIYTPMGGQPGYSKRSNRSNY